MFRSYVCIFGASYLYIIPNFLCFVKYGACVYVFCALCCFRCRKGKEYYFVRYCYLEFLSEAETNLIAIMTYCVLL